MQSAPTYRTNRDLFSNHYLEDHLPDTDAWNRVSEAELRDAHERITSLWERERDTAPKRNESQLEETFIRPVFRALGIPFEVEETVERGQRRPDYGFFESEEAARGAFGRRDEGGDFYESAVAVADAKRWGRGLDTRGERERDFENPSYQIHVYLQETATQWAVLTNGKQWRLYYGPTSHRLDSYYEIDLPAVLEAGDLEAFKYFYLFFRQEAFLPDAGGDSFLDDVYDGSNVFAQELGEDVQDNVYEAIKVLAEGFLQYPDNDLSAGALDEADLLADDRAEFADGRLALVHDASLIYLYRLIFVLYAESEGRDLLDTDNDVYAAEYSLNGLKQEVAEKRDRSDVAYHDWQNGLWSRLEDLFALVDRGSEAAGIPPEQLQVPAYNGGLFRTDPEPDDSREARFLARYEVGDAHLAEVVDLLARSENATGGGKSFVDYSSLDIRHLGSIYEGLLEYDLNVADEPLTLDDGEYAPADPDDEVAVASGDVYLTTDSGERKATGSYYTPEYVVEYIVETTLGPVVDDIYEDLLAADPWGQEGGGQFAADFAERVFELKILDPAMGSGHFLTSAVDYLAREIVDAQERQAEQQGVESIDRTRDVNWARRQVAQRCIYGVDRNPLAVELAKVSLWLRTLAADQPLAFLDHHLKTGNSLVGSDIEDVLSARESATDEGQLTLRQSFARTRQRALEHVMDRFRDLLSTDNESLADVKRMEAAFEGVRDDPLYRRLLAMANVHTAAAFGVDVPGDADERMAEALRDDSWADVADQDWFERAQAMAEDERFFHWELEFPVAFYDETGTRRDDAGFDVVLGNPPYVNIELIPDDHVAYYREAFATAQRRLNLYVLFAERALSLSRAGGRHSFIVPDKLLSETYATNWRRLVLDEHALGSVLDLRDETVFPDASVDPVVYAVQVDAETGTAGVYELEDGRPALETELRTRDFREFDECRIRLDWNEDAARIVDRLAAGTIPASRIVYASWGAQPGNADRFFRYGPRPDDPAAERLIKGGNVDRYAIQWSDSYIRYHPEELHRPAFPALFESEKLVFKDIAGSRGLIGSLDREGFYTDHTLVNCISKADLRAVDEETLRGRGIVFADEPRGAAPAGESTYDRDTVIYPEDEARARNYDLRALLGMFNSTLLGFYYRRYVSGNLHVFPQHVRDLPVPDIDFADEERDPVADRDAEVPLGEGPLADAGEPESPRAAHDRLAAVVERRLACQEKRDALNLDLRDHLGSYEEGPTLPDAGLFRPTDAGILDATAEAHEKLRIGDVRVDRDGDRVTVSASARYKPADDGDVETDRYGYTETEYEPAFALTEVTDETAALIEAFVPVAVADEIAGFRGAATKTISLTDRLKAIRLPDPDDVAEDLRRYREVSARADELAAEIERADRRIDDLVYDLYGLTESEVEIVEASVDAK